MQTQLLSGLQSYMQVEVGMIHHIPYVGGRDYTPLLKVGHNNQSSHMTGIFTVEKYLQKSCYKFFCLPTWSIF